MYTFQDFRYDSNMNGISETIDKAINLHKSTLEYKTALDADNYDMQRNTTIMQFTKQLFTNDGEYVEDVTASNNKICSSFFRRLNTQRNTYSLGNGVTFENSQIKEELGLDFDTKLKEAGYYALIHGEAFMFWNVDHIHVYKITEFVPLYDEETGALQAGIRFWQIDDNKPTYAVLYEIDGYSKYRKSTKDKGGTGKFEEVNPKSAYRVTYSKAKKDIEAEIVGEENYNELPIITLYGSRLKQSTLIGMKGSIDAYDLVKSGFANDMQDCSQIYWIINNAGGMNEKDLGKFRDRLRLTHIAKTIDEDITVTPYTQEIPYQARKEFLDEIRSGIYEDFGGLDIHTISAGSTNDHIEAGYQPLDEQADDYEYEIIDAIQRLEILIGIKDVQAPLFNRNRISNQKEKVDMIIECANYLDDETVLKHLPFLSSDEVASIIERKEAEEYEQFKDDSDVDLDDSDDGSDENGLDIITE